jgi:hypothetical protein
MVQIVTVSANTAAYAAEGLKPSARVSGVSQPEKAVHALAAEARKSGDPEQRALLNVVQPPSIALFFLTAEKQPDGTYQQVHEEYLEALAEYRAEHHPTEPTEEHEDNAAD